MRFAASVGSSTCLCASIFAIGFMADVLVTKPSGSISSSGTLATDETAGPVIEQQTAPVVWVMTPAEYSSWKKTRVARQISEQHAKDDEAEDDDDDDDDASESNLHEEQCDGGRDDAPAKKKPSRGDDGQKDAPATVHGIVFESMPALRKYVKAIIARGNPVAKEDAEFLVDLLQYHPKAKSIFDGATNAPTYSFRVQELPNGDHGMFIEKFASGDSGRRTHIHCPHKLAVKHFFPLSSRPRRQTWHQLQKRKRTARK